MAKRRRYRSGGGKRRSGGGKGGGVSGKTLALIGLAGIGGYMLYEKMNGSLGAAHAVQTAKVQAANPQLSQDQAAIAAAAQLAQAAGSWATSGAGSANSLPFTNPANIPSSS